MVVRKPDKWSFASNVVTLNPDGTKCDGNTKETTNLTLRSNVTRLLSNEKLLLEVSVALAPPIPTHTYTQQMCRLRVGDWGCVGAG